MSTSDNPPAFPNDPRIQLGDDYQGMALRDWFAGQAMFEGVNWVNEHQTGGYPEAAAIAYEFADAMLAARKERGNG